MLRYVCNLKAHAYKPQERPDSCLKWDQSSWSNLYRCITYGFRDDHCNSGYSCALHLLLVELSPIGNDYRRLQALYKRLPDNGNPDAFRDDTSDGLEAVGGISGGSFREAWV